MSADISQLRFDFVHFSMVICERFIIIGSMQFNGVFQFILRVSQIDGRVIVMAICSHCSVGLVESLSFADKIMDSTVSFATATPRNDI